jgi:hypothetical protein
MPRSLLFLLLAVSLFACTRGNVRSARDYSPPPAPPVRNSVYNPYAAYGEADATWQPSVWNRDGTIVKPVEPASQADRPRYELAPWASGTAGGSQYTPPGTF